MNHNLYNVHNLKKFFRSSAIFLRFLICLPIKDAGTVDKPCIVAVRPLRPDSPRGIPMHWMLTEPQIAGPSIFNLAY